MRSITSIFLVAATVVVPWAWPGVARGQFHLEPNRLYQTTDFGIRQYSSDLHPTGVAMPPQIAGAFGMVGGAVSPDGGRYLVAGYLSGAGGLNQGARLFVLDAGGNYVRDLPLTNIGLNRASHIVFDHANRLYVGSPAGLHEFGADLSGGGIVPVSFGRVAGLALDAADRLFVADQDNDRIVMLDETRRQVLRTFNTGRVPMGMDFAPDGSLYYTDTPFRTGGGSYLGRLVRLDPVSGTQTVIFDNLQTVVDVEFLSDGSLFLATGFGARITHYSPTFQPLETFSDGTPGDVINFIGPSEVPEPAGAALVVLAAGAALSRRRRGRRR